MKITGYALREALKQHELVKSTAEGEFRGSLTYTEEVVPVGDSPQEIVSSYEAAELAISKLETAQAMYNLAVTVNFEGKQISLLSAIKLVGFLGRVEKMWKTAIANPVQPVYYENQKPQKRSVSAQEALNFAKAYGKKCNTLRAAIAVANGVEIDIPDLDPSIFD